MGLGTHGLEVYSLTLPLMTVGADKIADTFCSKKPKSNGTFFCSQEDSPDKKKTFKASNY